MSWLWIIPVLGVLVIIHELGHFVSARMLGIRVEEFGLGIPPRLFAIRHNNIDYSLNALPIGGFVKILGENGESAAPDSFGMQPAWKRIIVLAAGSLMNLLLALLLFIALGLFGDRVADNTHVGFTSISADSPAAKAQLQPGDLLLAVGGVAVNDIGAARDALNSHYGQPVTLTISRGGQQLSVPVTLRNPPQPALGVILEAAVDPVKVVGVQPNTAAAAAGLRAGDVITGVDGKPATSTLAVAAALNGMKDGPVTLTVTRGGVTQTLQATVSKGFLDGWSYEIPSHLVTYSPAEAIGRGFSRVGDLLRRIPESLATVISGLFTGQNAAGSFAGPVGIAQLTGEIANEQGLNGIIALTGLLGINLFLFNMLPLPALDGGRLLFILIELLRGGRKVPPEREGMVHAVGMIALLALILLITISDVIHLFEGGSILHPR
ncbi:MAG TPA: RIP metalloprotease RseP [Chloroflexia bacterium]|nr:RIP metalloprotease RseP [Chloroflexia bacterium]